MSIASGKIVYQEEVKDDKADISNWNKGIKKRRTEVAPGATISEVFLNQCRLSSGTVACADGRVGIQTYSQLKLRSILLAEYLRKLPGKYIGIPPASSKRRCGTPR
jgi:long-chain-fatty-acid--[acyl-carrier-protein] ligase